MMQTNVIDTLLALTDEDLICFSSLFRKPWNDVSKVLCVKLRFFRDLAGEKSFTKWTKRHKADA